MLLFEIMVYFGVFFTANWLYGPLPEWTGFLSLALMLVLLFSGLTADFYNYVGEGVLSLATFMEEFKNESDEANFGKLLLGAKRINKIAKYYNMQISPYPLSLGMTISFIENGETTQKYIRDIIEWLECPTKQKNFKEFRKLVKKFNSIAKKSSKDGIMEKHHWSFESIVTVLSAIVIPVAIAIIAIVIPKLLEVYWK